MRLCVISDLHTRFEVAELIIDSEYNNVDKFVFLGDYFDDYDDTVENNIMTAQFLKRLLHDEKFVFLIGNHDLHYIFDVDSVKCKDSFTQEKFTEINKILTKEDWSHLQWAYMSDNWLLSHAGIDTGTTEPFQINDYYDKLNAEVEKEIFHGQTSEYLKYPDGLVWFKDIGNNTAHAINSDHKPFNQIFGHTVLYDWSNKTYATHSVYNIDTHNQHYAIADTETNHVEIRRTGYYHRYHRNEIEWLRKTNQI